MPQSPHLLIVGSHGPGLFVHVKRIPAAGETVMGWGFEAPVDGAKGSNQAVAAARLGRQFGLLTIINPSPAPEGGLAGLRASVADILAPNETEAQVEAFLAERQTP